MGRSSNCLKILYFSIGMHYEGIVYSEYLSCPQVHLTSWGDVLQSAQSRQAVLWVVGIQIIHLLDEYHSIYLLEGTHMIFGHSSAVPPWLTIFPFLVKIVENTYNLVNSCSIYVKISASQLLCKSEGDCIFRF